MENSRGTDVRLSPRLAAVAGYVRQGAVVADIGTDHALLPVYLLETGKASFAVASDIIDGPVRAARARIAAHPEITGRAQVIKTDGLCGIERFCPRDIMICGMGGETIAGILARSSYAEDEGIHLILQPMSSVYELRMFLAGNGYDIISEKIVREDKSRLYSVILACYSGTVKALTPLEATLGAYNINNRTDNYCALLEREKRMLMKKADGMKKAGLDFSWESALLCEMEKL